MLINYAFSSIIYSKVVEISAYEFQIEQNCQLLNLNKCRANGAPWES